MNNIVKEQSLSPSKKRSRDQVEELRIQNNELPKKLETSQVTTADSHRSPGSEPELKRHRDMSNPTQISKNDESDSTVVLNISGTNTVCKKQEDDPSEIKLSAPSYQTKEAKLTFESSGFASLATSKTSPFGCLGSNKPSIFSGGINQLPRSSLSTLPPSTHVPGADGGANNFLNGNTSTKSDFGSKVGLDSSHCVGQSIFGSKQSNAFTHNAGSKLSSFATPGAENQLLDTKPIKAFGAPESDDNDSEVDETENNGRPSGYEEDEHQPIVSDERKKNIFVKVDNGETGEVTILQVRAKLFALNSKTVGWKERGVGTLKINVPKSCVKYDKNGHPIPSSFDISNLKNDEDKSSNHCAARLIMRQENTHRVVLNTVIHREMNFEEKPAVSSAQIAFTALEGEVVLKPIKLLLKMTESNAKLFITEIKSIQLKLELLE